MSTKNKTADPSPEEEAMELASRVCDDLEIPDKKRRKVEQILDELDLSYASKGTPKTIAVASVVHGAIEPKQKVAESAGVPEEKVDLGLNHLKTKSPLSKIAGRQLAEKLKPVET
jgi:transcription initiation factor TFIIIB Brf1 subunit/transcription initiation factor TFIIB